jgi:predicted nucleotidyltransferase
MKVNEIKEILSKHKENLRRKFRVKEIGLFGSYVRGEQKETSDVDVLVEFEETPTLLEFVELENYLSELLGVVDLVMKRALKSNIKKSVLKEVVYVMENIPRVNSVGILNVLGGDSRV